MKILFVALVAWSSIALGVTAARAQEPRPVALVYELELPPLFMPNGEPEDAADFHVDVLLRHIRSLETEHTGDTFAISIAGVACDELALIDTEPARRALRSLRRVARDHMVLKTLHAEARLEHLTSRELKDEVSRGVRSVERCTGVEPRDPLVPPGLAVVTEQRASDLRDADVRSILSAHAVPPTERRPRVVPAVEISGSDSTAEAVAAARPEAREIAVLVPMERASFLDLAASADALDVVDIGALRDVDVIGGVIDQSFDVPAPYVRAISVAERSLDRFRSYALENNPLVPVFETVVARSRSTEALGRKGLEKATDRANALSDTITEFEADVGASQGTVTFTARRGSVPITVSNRAGFPIRVRVELSSPKLDFGSTSGKLVTPVTRVDPPGETITFQAVARSSGTFPVEVLVKTPDGIVLGRAEVTVRSAAANLSAVALTAGAAVFFIYWFVRRRRPVRETVA